MNEWFDAEQRVERAGQLSESMQWNEALAEIDAALEINPHNVHWQAMRGAILDQLDRFDEAVAAYSAALSANGPDCELMTALGRDLARLNRYAESLKVFSDLAHAFPDYEPAYCHRIAIYALLGDHDHAEEMFYLAQQIQEECPHCFFHLGESLFARKLYRKAIYCWERTLEIDAQCWGARKRIGDAHRALGDHEQAKSCYLDELRNCPGDVELIFDLATLLLLMGDQTAAAEKLRQAIELCPEHAPSLGMLGVIHLNAGEWETALGYLHSAESFDDQMEQLHYLTGSCLMEMQRWRDARVHLEKAVAQDPQNAVALMKLGGCLVEMRLVDQAADVFRRVIALDAGHPAPYQNLAICAFVKGDFDSGINHVERALRLGPEGVGTMHKLLLALVHVGRHKEAKRLIRRMREVDPDNTAFVALEKAIRSYRLSRWAGGLLRPAARWLRRFRRKTP